MVVRTVGLRLHKFLLAQLKDIQKSKILLPLFPRGKVQIMRSAIRVGIIRNRRAFPRQLRIPNGMAAEEQHASQQEQFLYSPPDGRPFRRRENLLQICRV
jgi:hypothetical protein